MKSPSIELLSKVLNRTDINSVGKIIGNNLVFGITDTIGSVNIYEFAHKCKEWAYKVAKFPIKLETSPTDEYGEEYSIGSWFLCGIEGNHPKTNNTIKRDTLVHYGQNEPEAIFAACEWILKQLKGI